MSLLPQTPLGEPELAMPSLMIVELIEEIVSYLPPSDQYRVLISSWVLHDVTARLLYRHIKVFAPLHGYTLLKTLSSSRLDYGRHTRTLEFGSPTIFTYSKDIHRLISDTLPKLTMLLSLAIGIRSDFAPFLPFLVKRFGVRSSVPMEGSGFDQYSQVMGVGVSGDLGRPSGLHTYSLCGDIRLLNLGIYRSIRKLCVDVEMEFDEMEFFFDVVASGEPNTVLEDLELVISSSVDCQKFMRDINQHFPNLLHLSVRCRGADALVLSKTLTLQLNLLPALITVSFNAVTLVRACFAEESSRSVLLELQRDHLICAGNLRPSLECVIFGTIMWSRETECDPWELTILDGEGYMDDDPNILDIYDHEPLLWPVYYIPL